VARLFSALVPPAPVLDHLAGWLAEHPIDAPLRWGPRDRWHVTIGFFGDDDDPDRRTKWLRRRVAGRLAPALRLAGAGTFPGVLWVGVRPDTETDARRLATLGQAAGAGRAVSSPPAPARPGRTAFHPHLTLARWRSGTPDRDALIAVFAGYTGPWFTPDELLLMRSDFGMRGEHGSGGPTYTTVDRLPLASA
jgi:2'-5' RNA ligase